MVSLYKVADCSTFFRYYYNSDSNNAPIYKSEIKVISKYYELLDLIYGIKDYCCK